MRPFKHTMKLRKLKKQRLLEQEDGHRSPHIELFGLPGTSTVALVHSIGCATVDVPGMLGLVQDTHT